MHHRSTRAIAIAAVAAFAAGCAEPCEFEARCDGNVLETCFLHPDQFFGDPVSRNACEAPNPFCVEPVADMVAFCAAEPTAECTEADPETCDGALALRCREGFVRATNCATFGPDCIVNDDDDAVCAQDPIVACDPATHERRCIGDNVERCRDGRIALEICETITPQHACSVDGFAACRIQ